MAHYGRPPAFRSADGNAFALNRSDPAQPCPLGVEADPPLWGFTERGAIVTKNVILTRG